jgi:hypothetical protein
MYAIVHITGTVIVQKQWRTKSMYIASNTSPRIFGELLTILKSAVGLSTALMLGFQT